MTTDALIACHECDLLHRTSELPVGSTARCSRCGAVLYRQKRNSLDRTLTMVITGLILFVIANSYPFLSFKMEGIVQQTTLLTGVRLFYESGMHALALLVVLTTVVFPLAELLGLLYVLLPLKLDRVPWKMGSIFRFVRSIEPWGMMEVFMLGILASVVKLAQMASIIPGISMYAFAALIVVIAAAAASLDPRIVWDRVEMPQ
jgi:paraquat-inducible protein A